MAEMELAGVNLPYSLDAEQSVLGAILLDGNANMPKASAKLHPEHFYVKVHTDIYTVMMQMFAASDNIDVVTVLENCMKNNVFESQEEGRNYLVKLMETVPSISSVDRYIEIVEDKYTRRLLISIAGDILENANEGQTDTAALLELAEKTSFAMNMATNVAKYHPEKSICVFNLEMSKEQLVKRMLSSEGRISSELMSTGRFDPAQWRNLADAAFVLSNMNIYIDDSSAITVNEMKAKLRRVDNLGLIVIDYLQLISSGRRDLNRVNEISEMTRNLKIMAKELNVPIIVLSQLARSAEKKDDKRPMLSDLRDSGSIEQDADIVLFLYRDSYYNKEAEDQRACKCIVAKNRHGETNDINMIWDGQYTRFTDVEYVHAEQ